MSQRTLTITLQPDWKAALREAGRHASVRPYQVEVLNFESPGAFFGLMTERRWALVGALQGQGEISLREPARRVERDVKRVHEDVQELLELGLVFAAKTAAWCAPLPPCASTWSCTRPPEGSDANAAGTSASGLASRAHGS